MKRNLAKLQPIEKALVGHFRMNNVICNWKWDWEIRIMT